MIKATFQVFFLRYQELLLSSATRLSITLLCANQNYWFQIDYAFNYRGKEGTLWESVVIESVYWEIVTTYILNTKQLGTRLGLGSMSWYKIRCMWFVVEKLEDGQTKVIVSTITYISCQIMPQMFHISNQSIPKLCSINTAKLYVIVKGTHIVSSLFLSWSSRQYNTLQLQFLPNRKTYQKFQYCF